MNRCRLKSNFIIGLVAAALLAGCAGQVPHDASLNTDAHAEANNSATSAQNIKPAEAEQTQVIQEESAVFFTLGSAAINNKEKQKLQVIAQRLVSNRNQHVLLLGYANDNGSSSYNLAVSDSRVTAATKFLRKHGVQNGQIKTQSRESEKLTASCRSLACRQKSRRVDLVISEAK